MKQIAMTLGIAGVAAIIGAMLLLDVDNWETFVSYFVLIPLANICFAIALWIGVHELAS